MVLRPRVPTTAEEKVKQKVKGNKIVASGKIGIVDSKKGEIVRKDRRNTETAENIVKRVKTMNKNEIDKGPFGYLDQTVQRKAMNPGWKLFRRYLQKTELRD
ncbi:hypothetical protein AgCh_020271 [Apium graveolens]